jgi:hypothetical protein
MVARRDRVVSNWIGADEAHFSIVVIFSIFGCFARSHGMGSRSCRGDILSCWVGGYIGNVRVVATTTTPLTPSSILVSLSSASSSVALTVALGLGVGGCYSSVVVPFRWSHSERP